MAREQRFVFDEIAELYRRARPSYPDALVDDVIRFAGVDRGSRALELGCGTGKASVLLARRGLALECLEPGESMAAAAREELAPFPDVSLSVSTFEAWPAREAAFDLVFSAQAFHWIDPEVRLVKSARCLRPGAALAVFGNRPQPGRGPLHEEIQLLYARLAPALAGRPGIAAPGIDRIPQEIAECAWFEDLVTQQYPWSESYDAATYTALMQTQSDHRMLPAEQLAVLVEAVHAAIEASGECVEIDYVARLALARRRPEPAPRVGAT